MAPRTPAATSDRTEWRNNDQEPGRWPGSQPERWCDTPL